MITSLFLSELVNYGSSKEALKKKFGGAQTAIVIGVKNSSLDLDRVLEKFPNLKIAQRFPEAINNRYIVGSSGDINTSNHTLQAALVTFVE